MGFKGNKNIFRRLYNRYSGFFPFIAVFSLGIFGSSIYYKNQPALTAGSPASYATKLEAITNQLNSEKDITDSLSGKNIELKQRLKEALSKASNTQGDAKVAKLTSEFDQEKQQNQKLNDENARLKVRINNMLAQAEATKSTSNSDVTLANAATTGANRNTANDSNVKVVAKDKNFNKVKMDSTNDSKADNHEGSLTNRNGVPKLSKTNQVVENKEEKKIVKEVVKATKKRTMKLQKGESLWNLSKRAYGKGIYYKKIIKANPSITEKSFKRLRPGAEINVPL